MGLGAWHYNGHTWSQSATGHGLDGGSGLSAGRLTPAGLPGGPYRINVVAVALIPGTTDLLGGGEAHAYANPGSNVVAVILQYGA
ncbi:MAG: hypothetical protein ACRDOU_29225 [Streptosporangiaceae bacterium]